MTKLVFVLLDGCSATVAQECMGYMGALTSAGQAQYVQHTCALPALSRPLYHCILTGLLPSQSGIVHNTHWQPHPAPTIFHKARAKGLITAAAAYYWMSELCNHTPYSAARDRLTIDCDLPLSYGLFYDNDAYPDDHAFKDAESLRLHFTPHLLLVHPMGIDHAGHVHGANSPAYRNAVRSADMLLARYVPLWHEAGYTVVVTSDHGMHEDKMHNGQSPQERDVPVWCVGDKGQMPPSQQDHWHQWCCTYLGIEDV